MNTDLPASLQPTAADIARDNQLARESKAILEGVTSRSGLRLRINQQGYNAVTFGPDGKPVSRIVNGVAQQSEVEEAVTRAQSVANGDIQRLEAEIERLTAERDEISAYEPDGTPRYARSEAVRQSLEGQIRQLQLTKVNQQRLNERRWRESAAPAVRRSEEAQELMRELEAKGRVTRANGW